MFGIEIICFSLGNDVLLIRMIFILFLFIKGCEVNKLKFDFVFLFKN